MSKKVIVKTEEVKYDIETFCIATKLNKYHTDTFKMCFNKEENKTVEQWKKFLLDKKLIKKEEFK
jgi:hypothetical protein